MGIEIGWFQFAEPFSAVNDIPSEKGVFVVLANEAPGKYLMLDVDQGDDMVMAISNHARRPCWKENCWGTLAYSYYRLPESSAKDRDLIVKEIRTQYSLPCGDSVESEPFGIPKPWDDHRN